MKQRKVPLRKCVGCMEQKPKKELVRVSKTKDGLVSLDLTGKAHGRGAYLCNSKACLEKAVKKKALNRALETEISNEILEEIKGALKDGEA